MNGLNETSITIQNYGAQLGLGTVGITLVLILTTWGAISISGYFIKFLCKYSNKCSNKSSAVSSVSVSLSDVDDENTEIMEHDTSHENTFEFSADPTHESADVVTENVSPIDN